MSPAPTWDVSLMSYLRAEVMFGMGFRFLGCFTLPFKFTLPSAGICEHFGTLCYSRC
jgi:hypothetical protein